VVVVADHGEEFGEHGGYGHGQNLYQVVLHVPLMLRVPGMTPHRVEAVVPTVDLMPTLLELCWASTDVPIQGQSLLPLLRGAERPEREAVSELKRPQEEDMRSLRLGAWKYIDPGSCTEFPGGLFALDRDPWECADTVEVYPEVAQVMRARLAQQLQQAHDLGRGYGESEASQLSPAEKARLKNLGYVEEDK
jgi:arylsulfatase A-like enzyme